VEWLKVKALSSNSSTIKKKKDRTVHFLSHSTGRLYFKHLGIISAFTDIAKIVQKDPTQPPSGFLIVNISNTKIHSSVLRR
jgi:hypothetical protein